MPEAQRAQRTTESINYPVNDNMISVTNSTTLILRKDQNVVRPFMNQLITSGGYRNMVLELLNRAVECHVENWGGCNECAIEDTTINNAKIFLKFAENELDWFPSVSVSDEGHFVLEWSGDKYTSYVSINQYGVIFLKTHRVIIDGDEDNKTIVFADKTEVELRNSLWKIFKAINDKDSI